MCSRCHTGRVHGAVLEPILIWIWFEFPVHTALKTCFAKTDSGGGFGKWILQNCACDAVWTEEVKQDWSCLAYACTQMVNNGRVAGHAAPCSYNICTMAYIRSQLDPGLNVVWTHWSVSGSIPEIRIDCASTRHGHKSDFGKIDLVKSSSEWKSLWTQP